LWEQELGTAAELLLARGDLRSVAMIASVKELRYDEDWVEGLTATLEVAPWMFDQFVNADLTAVQEALSTVGRSVVEKLQVVPRLADDDWRERIDVVLLSAPTDTPSNQARLVKLPVSHPAEDGMHFRDPAELAIYRALKRAQARLGGEVSITCNVPIRMSGRTLEVDFMVCYKGRVGVIEVDGATHYRKRASDLSRERLLEDAGIARIDRIDVEDTANESDADIFVGRFLKRLGHPQ
jgi:hypothetical protein